MLHIKPHTKPKKSSARKQHNKKKSHKTLARSYATNPRYPDYEPEKAMDYAPGSKERAALQAACAEVRHAETAEVPIVINGKKIFTGNTYQQVMPSNHKKVLANVHLATPDMIHDAITSSMKAKAEWAALPQTHRTMVFRRAADLIATKHRARVSAVTMLSTGKTVWQAEIDAIQEQCDFLRLNGNFVDDIAAMQPPLNAPGVWNRMKYRPLEGFIAAIAPFNFLAIGTNLNAAPAILGNTTLWKPSMNAALSNYEAFEILREAGLPDGVINFVPAHHDDFNRVVFHSKDFGGLHFTGSTDVFSHLWQEIGNSLHHYKAYPRIVGETGGKNFHLIHPSADMTHSVNNLVRGAFEFQGQKCSATSRAYIPRSMWNHGFRDQLIAAVESIKMGQPDDFSTFMTAVISKQSAQKHHHYIEQARQSDTTQIIAGGKVDTTEGWFVEPTVLLTTDPHSPTMVDELFGPVLTVYVYEDHEAHAWEKAAKLADTSTKYGLTGSIFARDRHAIDQAEKLLVNAAGNLYINDKSTGAVVGAQPFGAGRMSGTNDKAGSVLNLMRWCSPQSIKETSTVLTDYTYPHMANDKF